MVLFSSMNSTFVIKDEGSFSVNGQELKEVKGEDGVQHPFQSMLQ